MYGVGNVSIRAVSVAEPEKEVVMLSQLTLSLPAMGLSQETSMAMSFLPSPEPVPLMRKWSMAATFWNVRVLPLLLATIRLFMSWLPELTVSYFSL